MGLLWQRIKDVLRKGFAMQRRGFLATLFLAASVSKASVSTTETPQTRKIPVDSINPLIFGPDRDPESYQLLKESIQQNGQLTPIKVCKTEKGYQLIGGQRRLQIVKDLGQTHILATI